MSESLKELSENYRGTGVWFRIVLGKGGKIRSVSNQYVMRRRSFLFDIDVVVRCSYSEVSIQKSYHSQPASSLGSRSFVNL